MKKKINKQQYDFKQQSSSLQKCYFCKSSHSKYIHKSLFQFNYQLVARTINEAMQKQTYQIIISKIIQKEPSKQLIAFQQIQKNLVFQEYIQQYTHFDRIPDKMRLLIPKHINNVKTNYMDFKIKNFLILNKYKVSEKVYLPYPLCIKFQKLTDSKMSSTKSVENKVLQQLEKQIKQKKSIKRDNFFREQKIKKANINKKFSNQKFEIKALTKSIGQMIQNIKQVRALQNFKKQMQKSSQFKFGILKYQNSEAKDKKQLELNEIPKRQVQIHQLKEKQFKKKVLNDMVKYFPDQKKPPRLIKKSNYEHIYQLPLNKNSKNKFIYKSSQRLQTNPDPDLQEYGLSIIRQKRKKSKSKHNKSKSRQNSRKSKQSSANLQFPSNKRLQTQYSSSSTMRLNIGYSMLMKSKSSSRIPTQYETGIIIKNQIRKSKSKSKNQKIFVSNLSKKQSKSISTSQQALQNVHDFKKSKSKSKINLLQFNSSNKAVKK